MASEKTMIKNISDMTPADKQAFLEKTKETLLREQGIPWEWMEKKIQEDLDNTFDDEKFLKMDPEFRVDAALARRDFKDQKPELVDYMLWMVSHSEYAEW